MAGKNLVKKIKINGTIQDFHNLMSLLNWEYPNGWQANPQAAPLALEYREAEIDDKTTEVWEVYQTTTDRCRAGIEAHEIRQQVTISFIDGYSPLYNKSHRQDEREMDELFSDESDSIAEVALFYSIFCPVPQIPSDESQCIGETFKLFVNMVEARLREGDILKNQKRIEKFIYSGSITHFEALIETLTEQCSGLNLVIQVLERQEGLKICWEVREFGNLETRAGIEAYEVTLNRTEVLLFDGYGKGVAPLAVNYKNEPGGWWRGYRKIPPKPIGATFEEFCQWVLKEAEIEAAPTQEEKTQSVLRQWDVTDEEADIRLRDIGVKSPDRRKAILKIRKWLIEGEMTPAEMQSKESRFYDLRDILKKANLLPEYAL